MKEKSSKKLTLSIYRWNYTNNGIMTAKTIHDAIPTAELKPLVDGKVEQSDEEEMGLNYSDLL